VILTDKHNLKIKCCLAIAVILWVIITGCAGDKVVKKDAFFEKWETLAETSSGHSPAPELRSVELSGVESKGETDSVMEKKELPVAKITMNMRQAPLNTFLQAMAKIAGLNILIKNDVKGEVTFDFKDVPWDQVFLSILRNQGLNYVWEGSIIRVMTAEDVEQDLKRKTQRAGMSQVEPLMSEIINISYADAKGLKENLQEFLTKDKDGKPRGIIRVDEHNNALIIQAIRDDLVRMMPIIEKIDRPTPQILIKANIVETTQDTARNLGIQWGGMTRRGIGNRDLYVTPGGSTTAATPSASDPKLGNYTPAYGSDGLSKQGFGVNFPATMSATASGTLGLMFGTLGGNILEMQLSALQSEGKLNILSSPSITTIDNQKAFTENGAKVPYVTEEQGTGGAVTKSVKFEDVVLRLEITPHVIDGKNLKMKILVKKDEVDESDAHKVQGNPRIIKKQTETSLIIRNGETIVISGLTKQKRTDTGSGIPLFKDIPVLGWLFKGEGKSESMEEVLIFITPTILPVQTAAALPEKPEKKVEESLKASPRSGPDQ
jgi:type IV pilus assembly protein PilQ